MSVDVRTEIDIARPVADVAAYAADPTNAPEWYANIESVEWKTDHPLQVGSVVGFVARFLGRRLAYTYEFVDLVPGERLVMRTAAGPLPDGDHLHLDPHRRRRHAHDPAQPGRTRRVLQAARTVHGPGDATSQPQGPRRTSSRSSNEADVESHPGDPMGTPAARRRRVVRALRQPASRTSSRRCGT